MNNRILVCTVLLFCILGNSFSQQSLAPLTAGQMDSLAGDIARVQWAHDLLMLDHEALSNDSLESPGDYYLAVVKNMWNYLNDSRISTYRLHFPWIPDSTIAVLRCSEHLVDHPKYYTIGINREGAVYLLGGFPVNDFPQLIRATIGQIDSPQKAEYAARIYHRTVLYSDLCSPIIDSTNVAQYASKFAKINPLNCSPIADGYLIRFYDIQTYQTLEEIPRLHSFRIDRRAEVHHEVTLLE